ncbi:hypothetical protein HZB02_04080 [Candidatus Woesearchaeota archaeon]|nr:hypothetical protein [Candidatus Woesearchaeota archaeon]
MGNGNDGLTDVVQLQGSSRSPFSNDIPENDSFFLTGMCNGNYYTRLGTIKNAESDSSAPSPPFTLEIDVGAGTAYFSLANQHDIQELLRLGKVDHMSHLVGRGIRVYSAKPDTADGFMLAPSPKTI